MFFEFPPGTVKVHGTNFNAAISPQVRGGNDRKRFRNRQGGITKKGLNKTSKRSWLKLEFTDFLTNPPFSSYGCFGNTNWMNSPSQTQVLIIGAGPSGLTAGAVLSRLGLKVRVIDKTPAASTQSKALGVQAGTLECLEQVFGDELPRQMIEAGVKVRQLNLNIENRPSVAVDLSIIPGRYNFLLTLPQSETERILEQKLNSFSVQVERSTELLESKDQGKTVLSQLRRADGTVEDVVSDFALGCDGAHSVIRHQLNIPFQGNPYVGNFILADVKVQWNLPQDQVHIFTGAKGVTAAFPLQEKNRFRFILVPKIEAPSDTLDISLEELKKNLSFLCPLPLQIIQSFWMSRFRVSHRRAETFQKGRLFLVGDAAHIHSPIGGQGMNTGIQDAVNLGYKIAKVLSQGAPLGLLEKYGEEREPVAKSILFATDRATRLMILGQYPLLRRLVFLFLPILGKSLWLQKKLAMGISQVQIARKEIKSRESGRP
jgi:3-(3-hydroxy-phenyl)propionate hydroxylase